MNKGIIATFFCAILLFLHLETAEAQGVANTKVQAATLSPFSFKMEQVNNLAMGKEMSLSKEEEDRLRGAYDLEPPEPLEPEFTSDWGMIYGDILLGSGDPAIQLGPSASRDLIKLVTYIIMIANL